MKNNAAAQTAQEVEKPKMTVVKPQEGKPKAEVINKVGAEVVQFTPVQEQQQVNTIEDIKRKGELLTLLTKRHDDLIAKRKRLESFAITNDNDTAEILLHDAKGENFKSHSPKAIERFIEFCKDEFTEAIKETENDMREIA